MVLGLFHREMFLYRLPVRVGVESRPLPLRGSQKERYHYPLHQHSSHKVIHFRIMSPDRNRTPIVIRSLNNGQERLLYLARMR